MASYTTDRPTTLFAVAAAQLGDALLWWQVAQLNSLSDPNLLANTTLVLPTSGAPDNGGVAPQ